MYCPQSLAHPEAILYKVEKTQREKQISWNASSYPLNSPRNLTYIASVILRQL